uniref:Uncharacterized protein n=1 Tax=Tetradesmus obliquus TaxID=3088 RepID=A0A383WGF9_TETOB|eukprot:jgi/Sobl393_1/1824/SZX76179.1
MSVLRQIIRRLSSQLLQLERAAASAALLQPHSCHAAQQTAGLSIMVQRLLPSAQHASASAAHAGAANWRALPTSSSGSSSWAAHSLQPVRRYSQCDCPMLGGPTPDTVVVEYDEEEVDRFIALADAIEAAFPNVVVEGNPEGPGRPGSFEVKGAANQLLFSRLDSGAWPQHAALLEALAAAAACSTSGEAAQQQA